MVKWGLRLAIWIVVLPMHLCSSPVSASIDQENILRDGEFIIYLAFKFTLLDLEIQEA